VDRKEILLVNERNITLKKASFLASKFPSFFLIFRFLEKKRKLPSKGNSKKRDGTEVKIVSLKTK